MYKNHADLRVAIQQSGVPREELWITPKVDTATRVLSKEEVKAQVDKLADKMEEKMTAEDEASTWRLSNRSRSDTTCQTVRTSRLNQGGL